MEQLPKRRRKLRRACIVVLGDFGHSPRMQNHAYSMLRRGMEVDVVANTGSKPFPELANHPKLKLHLMHPAPHFSCLPRSLALVFRTWWLALVLFWTLLFRVDKPNFVLVQNPPSVPVLPVVWLYARLMAARLVLDWHNYGHTILALNLRNRRHPLVRLYDWVEKYFGKRADLHFCVSSFMRRDLKTRYDVDAHVVYDRPTDRFKPNISIEEVHNLFVRLAQDYPVFRHEEGNRFTKCDSDGQLLWRDDRPLLVVSSTSWTEDEDMGLLMAAMLQYSQSEEDLPDLLCAITGRGPMKAQFEAKLEERGKWGRVSWVLPWLRAEDYPRLLACGDLGICLHTSSSGLDLPMKVVDMFGAGLPALAVDYPALSELLQPGVYGDVFNDAPSLAELLIKLISEPKRATLDLYRQSLADFSKLTWEENWSLLAAPMLGLPSKTIN